jgi:hypothetical protein
MSRKRLCLIGCAVASTALCFSTTIQAEIQNKTQESLASASALRGVIDKETGELRPAMAHEMEEMAQQQRRQFMPSNKAFSNAIGKLKHNANGSMSMVVDPSQLETVTATVNADGSISLAHGNHLISPAKAPLAEK